MLIFRRLELEDKPWVDKALKDIKLHGCDFSFGQLYQWREVYSYELCNADGGLIVKMSPEEPSRTPCYLIPQSGKELIKSLALLIEHAREEAVPLCLSAIEEEQKDSILNAYPNQFSFRESRDYFDYIYNSEDLIELSGRDYHSKRNHIARFLREHPDARYEPITEQNAAQCAEMESRWLEESAKTAELEEESLIIRDTLKKLDILGFEGGLIRADGKPVAFSIGEPLRSDEYVIHFEKALDSYSTAYSLINREFAAANCSKYKYVNREEDLGLDGLRQAKLSYNPAFLLKKYDMKRSCEAI